MRRLLFFSLFLFLTASAATALFLQSRAQTRGLDLGAPLNRPNIYGINIHLLPPAGANSALDAIKQAGFVWVRQSFNWEKNDWADDDALIAAAQDRDLKMVAVLTGRSPPDPAAFAAFAADFASRYSDQIDVYQIWDEPNLESGWSGPPNPAEYARLLQASYVAIHDADPTATVLLAGLAPTIETGPKNIGDVLYLRQLYELGAGPYFDAVAGKPYGFNAPPDDRAVDTGVLNFSRLILLREEMVAHGDGDKFLWSSHFGWSHRPSIWGQVTADQQIEYTRNAFARAQNEWQWAGPMFLETNRPNLPADDPHWGFAISDLSAVVSADSSAHLPGVYDPSHLTAYAIFDGAWEFSDLGADIPQEGPATITLDFTGTELALTARRADYRAYLFVTVDGQPANALPRDTNGNAYLILTSPDLLPRVETIRLASGLTPGKHTAVIRAERGWNQWAIVAVRVGPNVARPDLRWPLTLLGGMFIMCATGLVISLRKVNTSVPSAQSAFQRFGDLGQTILAATISAVLWASAWLTWADGLAQTTLRGKYGDTAPLLLTLLTAGLFYYSPFFILTLISLAALFFVFYLRPDLALPLIAFFAPLYLLPRPLWDRAFSMVEICTVLAVAATLLRLIPASHNTKYSIPNSLPHLHTERSRSAHTPTRLLDLSVLAFVLVSAASIFVAEIRGVAVREFRVIVLEPALFYFLFRFIPLDRKAIWRIVDFFLIGAVVVALIGLGNTLTGANLITAEGGVARVRSVFGSPNNLGLFLGRALPIAAAVILMGRHSARRLIYALAAIPIAAAILLSFSKGALLLGVPAGLMVVLLFWGGRRAAIALIVLAVVGGLALIPLSSHPRFADLLNLASGTSFFRIQLWRSAVTMFADHPILGVGLDNFLYQYRGRYILPEAWQEPNLPHAHNFILDFLTRTGLLGFAALAAMLISFFRVGAHRVLSAGRACLRDRKIAKPNVGANFIRDDLTLTVGLLASMIAALAHGLVDTSYWFVDLAFVFMMTLGLIAAIYRTTDAENSTDQSAQFS